MEPCLIDRGGGSLRSAEQYETVEQGRAVFFVKPDAFDLVAAINAHMRDASGALHKVDRDEAQRQWQALIGVYQRLGLETTVLEALPGCPDMVFCANQTFPFLDQDGKAAVILSHMRDDVRHLEVAAVATQLERRGVRLYRLPERNPRPLFEGMGDALLVPARRLICGGYGFRTDRSIYTQVHELTRIPIVMFELQHPKFYHLDTCLSILDARTVLACREGFTEEGWNVLNRLFSRVIPVPLLEADAPGFACNAHCPDQQHVILQKGNYETCRSLRRFGFIPIEVETGEYIKSGGSVFCLKMQTPWDQWPYEARG